MQLSNEEPVPIEADHLAMCKIRSPNSNMYEALSDYVARLVESAQSHAEHSEGTITTNS